MDLLLTALAELFEPMRLAMLLSGVAIGLIIGVIPGVGGIFGLTILIPITYSLDPIAAFALLLGMASVTTTSDTIPAVFVGVPGTVGAAATVLDGHELAKKRQAARALGAAYSASLIGGIFGALVLALSLPVMRPMVLLLNFADLFAVSVFGLTLVAMLSGRSPAKGVIAALMGALVAYTGLDPHEGVERWAFGEVYFWDGMPVAIVFLGLFGIPELADLWQRGQIQHSPIPPEPGGMRRGIFDTLRNWPLVLRSSALGSLLGAVPGVGVTVIEWVAYGDASRRPGNDVPFGEGNIRGVIAPESANNSKEGGSLLPTLAFGIPGSASMAILLGAFTIHGIVPGPDMLEDNAVLLVTMILTIALANVIGALTCLSMTRSLAKLAMVPAHALVPVALVFVALGAFHANKSVLDFAVLLVFGTLGIAMKRLGWSRPAFALGFVLGPNLERFFFLSYQISGWAWLTQPVVLVLFAVSVAVILRRLAGWRRGRAARLPEAGRKADATLTVLLASAAGFCALSALGLPFGAAIFPLIVSTAALGLSATLVARLLIGRDGTNQEAPAWTFAPDLAFLAASAALCLLILAFGHIAGPAAFVLGAAFAFGKPRLPAALLTALGLSAAIYAIFDLFISQPWPTPWIAALTGH
jgi:TctA family transporter